MKIQQKYFSRYAEPEAAVVAAGWPSERNRYAAVLVVPVFCESLSFLNGYQRATLASQRRGRRVLVIVVVNGRGRPEEVARNDKILGALRQRGRRTEISSRPPIEHVAGADFDLLVVDRSTPPDALKGKAGVGFARKIGCDIAAALILRGDISCPYLFNTDADATLPEEHFERLECFGIAPNGDSALDAGWRLARPRGIEVMKEEESSIEGAPAAVVFPFIHTSSDERAVNEATSFYEIWLRYYVAGLSWANSPYAYPAMGSSLAVHVAAYCWVRGFPQKQAGEDFYLLNKIAKVGLIALPTGAPVRLRSRRSSRTPFGTGSQVKAILEGGMERLRFYSPESFSVLRLWLSELARFSRHRDLRRLEEELSMHGTSREAFEVLSELGAFEALKRLRDQARQDVVLLERLLEWFDGRRTLRLLNELRARESRSLSMSDVVGAAPFMPRAKLGPSPEHVLEQCRGLSGPPWVGVSLAARRLLAGVPRSL